MFKGRLRKIHNFFCPKNHPDSVRQLSEVKWRLKITNNEIAKYDRLSEHGILGDSLWENLMEWERNKHYLEGQIVKLKKQYYEGK